LSRAVDQEPHRRVVELFAGVGGFRLGLERSGWRVIWSNQWEPHARRQWASECYVRHFGTRGHVCEDIASVVERAAGDSSVIPDHDLLTAGFPCQDYSVAKPLGAAHGIEGKKGVLWWEINKILEMKRPNFVLLENVDRLLRSPSSQRGRDFAVILSCFRRLGYTVEWRVVNAADYGFPQKRRRVFVVARPGALGDDPESVIHASGILARAFPVIKPTRSDPRFLESAEIADDPYQVTRHYAGGSFGNAGFLDSDGKYHWSNLSPRRVSPSKRRTLGDAIDQNGYVPPEFLVPRSQLGNRLAPEPGTWRYLKGEKSEPRVKESAEGRYRYLYKEGAIRFPDPLDEPARTIVTSEGGSSPSRFRHVVQLKKGGRYRRLLPEELERLNGFPPGWTDGMPPVKRAFMMGNSLVVGLVARIGKELNSSADEYIT
jgi:DNA (cytosine-5)-methyltransferase 1